MSEPVSLRAPARAHLPWRRRMARLAAVAVVAASLGGCAMFSSDPEVQAELAETNDPFEPFNRQMFAFNMALDTLILKPISVVYRDAVPDGVKGVIRNFVDNLKLPFTAVNDMAQGNMDRAGDALGRFMVNSTFGMAGLFDATKDMGVNHPYHSEDFGQTLATWGLEDGPYLVLPIFGPSNFRDSVGLAVGFVADPAGYLVTEVGGSGMTFATTGADAVDFRAENIETIDTLQKQSLDFYATVRSLYRQRRESEIRNGESGSENLRPGIARATQPAGSVQLAAVPVAEPDLVKIPVIGVRRDGVGPDGRAIPGEPQPTRIVLGTPEALVAPNSRTFDTVARSYRDAARAFDDAARAISAAKGR